jgi:hypothetical protein
MPDMQKMNAVYVDPAFSDDERRDHLYNGQLIILSPTPSSKALCDFAYELLEDAFAPHDPELAQYEMSAEAYAQVLSDVKPTFIHHEESKRLIQGIFEETGVDLGKTYFDVPRLRTSTSDDFLTSGIAYAFHPHRDTWYSAPMSQINWWLPVREITPENTLAFHPRYWDTPIDNSSDQYNYYEWNKKSRKEAAKHVKKDTRTQPEAQEEIELDPQVRPVCPPGGIVLFAGAQLHSSVPNTSGKTRLSIDFRTVHYDDVANHRGAPNIDSHCTGTTLRDYLRGTDLSRLPDELVAEYDESPPPSDAELIYEPEDA